MSVYSFDPESTPLWHDPEDGLEQDLVVNREEIEIPDIYSLEDDLPGAFDEDGLLNVPTFETLMEWMVEGECEALDGCLVEPDGYCPHGSPSWLLHLGMI